MKKKKILLIFTVILMFVNFVNGQTLSKKQKLEDFEFLYQTLKDNYPYFGVLKREQGIEWLDYKADFENAIKDTKTDKEFIKTISDILRDLHSGHTDLTPTFRRNRYTAIYQEMSRKNWLDNLSKGNNYWTDLYGIKDVSFKDKEDFPYDSTLLDCFIIDTNNIAVIKIQSFETFQIEKDIIRIKQFLKEIDNYPNLIIDIQDNGGGNSKYWSNNIVPLLTSEDIIYNNYYAIRNSEFIKSYFKEIKWKEETYNTISKLPNLPIELNEKDYYYTSDFDTIIGNKQKSFKGEIFLLVNHKVYSSAEGFAVFCKDTKWAKVVGETTAGDGVGIDPVIAILPNSKILFRFPGEMGLNPDGSSNEEMNTKPNLIIEARSSEERLYNFAKTINPKIKYIYHDIPPILNNCKANVLIYPTNERTDSLNIKIKKQIDYLNSKFFNMPDSLYLADTIALKKDLVGYNITCYGSFNGNLWTKKYLKEIPIEITSEYIKTEKKIEGNKLRLITSWFAPKSKGFYVRFYTSQRSEEILNINSVNHGMTNYVIANEKSEPLEYGNYIYKNDKYLTNPSR